MSEQFDKRMIKIIQAGLRTGGIKLSGFEQLCYEAGKQAGSKLAVR